MSSADLQNAQNKLRLAESRLKFAESTGNPNSIAVASRTFQAAEADLARVQNASAGNIPAQSVSPAQSPVARQVESNIANEYGIPPNFAETAEPLPPSFDEQLAAFLDEPDPPPRAVEPDPVSPAVSPTAEQSEAPSRRNNRQRAQAQRNPAPTSDPVVQEAEETFDEFSDIQRDIVEEPPVPTQDESVNENTLRGNRARAQAQRIENADAEDLDPFTSPAAAQVESNRERAQEQRIENSGDPDSLLLSPAGQQVDPQANRERAQEQRINTNFPEDVDPADDPTVEPGIQFDDDAEDQLQGELIRQDEEQALLDQQANALLEQARNQATVAEQRKANGTAIGEGDWRVRLRLAPSATYLYKAPDAENSILAPLLATDGIIFPYTPRIDIAYRADYQGYDPTHSNYRHYFYKGSRVEFVTMTATFTAQDTEEANYLLAVIHFLKSASKMFYGQDTERGSPPPLLYLTGLGEFQFNEAPCVLQEFNYNLPDDVDYIRARSLQISGADTLQYQRPLSASTAPSYSLSAIADRLRGSNLPTGATPTVPGPPNLGLGSPTYVPTKLSMTITLLPIQSRRQVSQQFSLREYANGNLIKGGFW